MDKVSQQELSRLAELAVEAELTKRGWLVGNFNASIKNAAVYDLFAVKDQFKTTLRVKGVRLDKNLVGNLLYAVKKNGEMFLNLKKGNDSDKKALEEDFKPISDMRASGLYRMEVAKNLLEKFCAEIKQKKLIGVYF